MSSHQDELLLSLQSSLRNALHTFGPTSVQYANISKTVDEHMAKTALQALTQKHDGSQTEEAKPWGGRLVFRVKGQ
ncbi:hypothetical protein K504DRAFT_459010 [Pleomassaria siparia CBS 279.74]|uniref:Uncharacterized protein n=1 Tax=Pleomassaria siparia CBS 279.74 TaxID=1314801 RepID=A0A6G1K1X8_9PLEO|nr:hypothetical protein K504DRAFT_459010 [Pleomassaria siparia CBS 279.74]